MFERFDPPGLPDTTAARTSVLDRVRRSVLRRRRAQAGLAGACVALLLAGGLALVGGQEGTRLRAASPAQEDRAGTEPKGAADETTTTTTTTASSPTTTVPVRPTTTTSLPGQTGPGYAPCRPAPQTTAEPHPGLRVTVVLERSAGRGGDEVKAEFVVENHSDGQVDYQRNAGVHFYLMLGSDTVGQVEGDFPAVVYQESIPPGGSVRYPFSFNLQQCGVDEPTGWRNDPLPPGTYELLAGLSGFSTSESQRGYLLAPRVQVNVTA